MSQPATYQGLGLRLEPGRFEQPLDEPRNRARDPSLERGSRPDALAQAREQPLVEERRVHVGRTGSGPRLVERAERAPLAALGQPFVVEVADVVDEQRARDRAAVVVGLVPAQEQPLLRARDDRVEQIALRGEQVAALAEQQPGGFGQAPALTLAEQRLRARAGREHALL